MHFTHHGRDETLEKHVRDTSMLLKVFCTYENLAKLDRMDGNIFRLAHHHAFLPFHSPRYGPESRDIDTKARRLAFPGYVQFEVDRAAHTVSHTV
jgi:hypothetical protein